MISRTATSIQPQLLTNKKSNTNNTLTKPAANEKIETTSQNIHLLTNHPNAINPADIPIVPAEPAPIDPQEALNEAVYEGDLDRAELYLIKGTDANANQNGTTLLETSYNNNNQKMAKLLLKYGADINKKGSLGNPVLHKSILEGNMEWVDFLLKNNADTSTTGRLDELPLEMALKKKNEKICAMLIGAKANVNAINKDKMPMLFLAMETNKPELVALILKNGGDANKPNAYKEEPIIAAAQQGNEKIVDLLINSGANKNQQHVRLGKSALAIAAKHGNLDVVKLLVRRGADLEIADNQGRTAIFDTVHRQVSWFSYAAPTKKQSDMTQFLLSAGAKTKKYEAESNFLANVASSLFVNHPAEARDFLNTRFTEDWDKSDNERAMALLEQFSAKTEYSKNDIDKLLNRILHQDINYEDQAQAAKLATHLRSWRGTTKTPHAGNVRSEGWWMDKYPPLKIKSLINSYTELKKGNVDYKRLFGEDKADILNKIKKEISAQMSTYFSNRHQDVIVMVHQRELKNELIRSEAKKYCREIVKTDKKDEFAIAGGMPGHAIYLGFRKQPNNQVSRLVYNLGAYKEQYTSTSDGRIYPHFVKNISMDHFIDESEEAIDYLSGVIHAQVGMSRGNDTFLVYDNIKQLNGEVVKKDIPGIPQKRQTAGNCVLKNNNAAARNRMKNDRLFNYLKKDETKFADEMAEIENEIKTTKEQERDIDSWNEVATEYYRTRNLDAAIDNFINFLESRFKSDNNQLEDPKKLRKAERIAVYLENHKNQGDVESWLKEPSCRQLLKVIAETKYAPVLTRVLGQFERIQTK